MRPEKITVPKWRLISEIFEPDGAGGLSYPVVVHMFYGQTRQEAQGYYAAHLTTDEFFRDCTERGNFRGQFPCISQFYEERLMASGWTPV